MKISLLLHASSTILLALPFVSGEETNSNLRSTPSEEERELESVKNVLERDECLPFVETQWAIMKDIVLSNSDSSIAAYNCNPIERKQTRKNVKFYEKLLKQDGIEPCLKAGLKLILNKKKEVKKETFSTANCRAEIKKEIIGFKELIKKEKRMLVEQEERGLVVFTAGAIVGLVTAGCGLAGTIATAGFAAAGTAATAMGAATAAAATAAGTVGVATAGAAGTGMTAAAGVATAGIGAAGAIGLALAKKKKNRRRQLGKLESALDFDDTEEIFGLCKDEMYSLFMYVESDSSHTLGHINMVAKPLDSNNEDCQEALVFDDYDAGERLISFVYDLRFDYDWQTDALSLGNFALGDMKAAADLATVVQPNRYDIMTNNCATFVIEMMGHLKIPINTEVKHYTVNSLVKSPGLVEAIGGSASAESSANKEMMWNFVSNYIEDHKLL